ncbi:MAG TPA: TIGR04325 family methyltransferase [Bryobacteraceae bacterium]|nr:TIGR04325 family methyltransferase [Bryobacteraceae bacterium]
MTAIGKRILLSYGVRRFVHVVEEKVPFVRAWHQFAYTLHFEESSPNARMFRGVYRSVTEASAAAPASLPTGHDHANLALRHASDIGHTWPSDYPILFWLKGTLPESTSVFDLGGSVGNHYYTFQKYLTYPQDLRWVVCEVPAVAQAGRDLVQSTGVEGLHFTVHCEEADGSDIFLASGVLPFIDPPLAELLSRLRRRPKYLLINRAALSGDPAFVTLHNLGQAVCPYRILNRHEFIRSLEGIGYRLVDSWENPEFSCYIPFHADKTVRAYSGFYFRLSDTAATLTLKGSL